MHVWVPTDCHFAVHNKCRDFAVADCTRPADPTPPGALPSSLPTTKKVHIDGNGPKQKEGAIIYDTGKYEDYVKIGKQIEKYATLREQIPSCFVSCFLFLAENDDFNAIIARRTDSVTTFEAVDKKTNQALIFHSYELNKVNLKQMERSIQIQRDLKHELKLDGFFYLCSSRSKNKSN